MTRSLRNRVMNATKWTAASVAAAFTAQFLQYVILARVLSPREVGQIAVVTLIMGLADLIVGMGVTQAIVQRHGVTSRELASLYWLNLGAALLTSAILFCASPLVASFFADQSVVGLVQLASVLLVIASFGQVSRAMLEKQLLFKSIAVAEVAGAATLLLFSATLALAGVGAASAVYGLIAAALVRNVAYRVRARRLFRLRAHFAWSETRRFLEFGLLQSVDSVINYVQNALSTVATGRFVSTAAMGGYNLSYNLAVNTPGKLNPIVTRVMFPVFSTLKKDDPRWREGYDLLNVAVGVGSIPGLMCLALVAHPVLEALYGPHWAKFAPVLAVLCFVGALRTLGNPLGSVIMAADRMRLGVTVNCIKAAVTIPLILAGGASGGALGAALGVAVSQVIGLGVSAGLLRRLIGLPVRRYLSSSLLPFALSVPMVLVLLWVDSWADDLGLWPALLLRLAIAGSVLGATFAVWPDRRLVGLRQMVMQQLVPRRLRGVPEIAVVLPAEERFDGTGGAVAHWVQRVYRECTRSYRIYSPSIGKEFSSGLSARRLVGYDLLVVLDHAARRLLGRDRDVSSRFLRDPRVYLRRIPGALMASSVVHLHNRPDYAGWLRRYGYRGRIVLHMHNDLNDYISDGGQTLRHSVDEFIFCSDYLRSRAEQELGIMNASTVHNGVDPHRSIAGALPQRRHLAFAGRIIEEKGVVEAVRVCERLLSQGEHYTLSLLGGPASGSRVQESDYFDTVRELVDDLNARFGPGTVVMRGHIPHDELLSEMAAAWAFVYPCNWEEPFGLVVAEAMAVGTPVIAYAKGGIPEVFEDGRSGRLIDRSAGIDAFVAAVREVDDVQVHDRMAKRAREDVTARFSWTAVAARTFALL